MNLVFRMIVCGWVVGLCIFLYLCISVLLCGWLGSCVFWWFVVVYST